MLRVVSNEVSRAEDPRLIVRDLRSTLLEFRRTRGFGRGISAIQIGEPKRIIYLDVAVRLREVPDVRTGKFETVLHPAVQRVTATEGGRTSIAMINPSFEWQSQDKFRLWDDCFSFPDLLVLLERAVTIRVRYQDLSGQRQALECSGAMSELIQHEIDHLDGILAVDRAIDRSSFCTREEFLRRHRATTAAGSAGQNS